VSSTEKYDRIADRYSEHEYTHPEQYAERAAELIVALGEPLEAGQSILDLACGERVLAPPLLARGLRYAGIDASVPMVEAARRRHPGVPFTLARLEEYVPEEPVDAAICLRAFYYAPDRAAFFRLVATYVRRKLVFDVRPSAYDLPPILAELEAAGFTDIRLRPFFLPRGGRCRDRSFRSSPRSSGRGRSRRSSRGATGGSSAPRARLTP
jgi:SAM-dependent methyltransferase